MSVPSAPAPTDQTFGHRPNGAVADPLDETHFADFFAARAEPQLKALEAERLAAVSVYWRNMLVCGVVAVVACILVSPFIGGRLVIVPIGLFLLAAGMFFKPLRQLGKEAKGRLMTAIADALGFTYQLEGFQPPGYDRLLGMGLLPKSERQAFDDLFTGQRSGVGFGVCDANLECEEGSGKDSHWVSVFRGQLVRIAFPKSFQGVTVIARDAGLLNMLHHPPGMQRVGLGASEFERAFEVYSTDQVEARFLVHPAFMEKLLDMEKEFNGSKLRGMFCEGELLLAVEGVDRFKFGNAFQRFDDIAQAQDVASDLRQVLDVIDFVLAGPPRAPELAPQTVT